MKKWGLVLAIVVSAMAAAAVSFHHGKDDETLARQLEGRWRAVDTSNAALHKYKDPVDLEEVVVQPDGTLLYTVFPRGNPKPNTDRWGWQVRDGRLLLQYRGEDGADAGTLRVKVSVSDGRLIITRKGHPAKEFQRPDN